ncbi:hypothetical protein E2320_005389, partial [Naja naja]
MNHSFGRRTGEGTCCSPATIGLFRSRGTSSLGSRPLGLLRTARKHSSAWDRLFGGARLGLERIVRICLLAVHQQYVYKRIWEETTNSTFIVQDNISHCELNQSNPIYVKQK